VKRRIEKFLTETVNQLQRLVAAAAVKISTQGYDENRSRSNFVTVRLGITALSDLRKSTTEFESHPLV
jgi:hypothetical protein